MPVHTLSPKKWTHTIFQNNLTKTDQCTEDRYSFACWLWVKRLIVHTVQLGRQRQVWLIPIADEHVDVQVKHWNPLRTRAIPERFCSGDSLRRGAISSVWTFTFDHTCSTVEFLWFLCREIPAFISPELWPPNSLVLNSIQCLQDLGLQAGLHVQEVDM